MPKISQYFASTLYALFQLGMVDLSRLEWVPLVVKEDDFIMPDINLKILAQFLKQEME